jgi:quercetin dioxygenase-like cupin family protein
MNKEPNSLRNHNDSKTEILNLKDLLKIQTGAVVSRTLINKRYGSITLFAFDKGEGLSEHTAPYDAIVYLLDGKAEIILSEKPYIIGGGEMIVMPARKPHSLKALESFRMMLIMIRSENREIKEI